MCTGPGTVHKEHKDSRGRHPDDNQAGQRTDRDQGVGHGSGAAGAVGLGGRQADAAERAAATGGSLHQDHKRRYRRPEVHY